MIGTEGLEAAWLGKGPATVARLAGTLELLAWSGSGGPGQPGPIGRDQIEAAASFDTNQVLYRLHFLGFVRPDRCEDRGPKRWQVNPALETA
jgi:hypothetical protein